MVGGDKNIENISCLIWDRELKKVKIYFFNFDCFIDSFFVFVNCSIVFLIIDCILFGLLFDCIFVGRIF